MDGRFVSDSSALTPCKISADTHVGLVRELNEDSFAYFADPDAKDSLVLVADGIGGHESGDIASQMCVKMIVEAWRKLSHNVCLDENFCRKFLDDELRRANEKIYGINTVYHIQHPMGTTVVAGAFLKDKIIVAHAGDSRCYMLRDGVLSALTFDHSFVAELMKRNIITKEEAAYHPFAHIISRSVGPVADLEPEVNTFDRRPGDRFLFCSDGLTNHVDDPELETVLKTSETPNEAVRKLLNSSLQKGGEDNITLVCVFA